MEEEEEEGMEYLEEGKGVLIVMYRGMHRYFVPSTLLWVFLSSACLILYTYLSIV